MSSWNHPFRKSTRLAGYDYSEPGAYFVTIVTANRFCLFGEIVGHEMILNAFGEIVRLEWERTSSLRKEVELGNYQILPTHFHGVIVIHDVKNYFDPNDSLVSVMQSQRSKRKTHSLGSIIAGFKSATTARINTLRDSPGTPVWQPNYYDHIIRNDKEWENINKYIETNILNWQEDEENPDSRRI
jgi:putative transposase